MAYTRHGHHIKGTSTDNPPSESARCGGPEMCSVCYQDVRVTWGKTEDQSSESEKTSEVDTNPFVDKFYEMNPETEDVLLDGTRLLDGMKVLVERPSLRMDVNDIHTSDDIYLAKQNNLWCVVTNLVVDASNNMVRFIGLYDDGIKRTRNVTLRTSWIVKKDSMFLEGEGNGDNYVVREIQVQDRGAASIILDILNNFISRCGFASIKDLSSLTNIPREYQNENSGWTDLKAAEVIELTDDLYILKLPPIEKRPKDNSHEADIEQVEISSVTDKSTSNKMFVSGRWV